MPKTEAEQIFDFLVSKIIWPYFKQRGYKKIGNNIRFYDNSGWGKMVNFQKSMYYNKEDIHFTINTGLYLAEAEQFHCKKQSFDKFQESMCMVRKRVGYLSNEKKDLWFDINNSIDRTILTSQIERYFIHYIIPYLDGINSRDDILQCFLKGHRSEYIAAQIETLFANGYKHLARQQLQTELDKATSSYFLETLKRIAKSFED